MRIALRAFPRVSLSYEEFITVRDQARTLESFAGRRAASADPVTVLRAE